MNPKPHILVVDDDPGVRVTVAMLLQGKDYDVTVAEDGFDALIKMKAAVPDVVVSDLNMPHMSGFEFLSVIRRRFPQVLVVAMSGAYTAGDAVPGGVIADAFHAKGEGKPQALLTLVAGLLENSVSRAEAHTRQSAPVWVPRNGNDTRGTPYIVLTCTECLRSFPQSVTREVEASVMVTPCIFCDNEVRYIIDFSLTVASPKHRDAVDVQTKAKAG